MLLTQQVVNDNNLNINEINKKKLGFHLNITNNQWCKCRPSAKHWLTATRIRVIFGRSLLNYARINE